MISDLTGANQFGIVIEDYAQRVVSPTPEPAGRPESGSLKAGGKASGMSSDLTVPSPLGVVVED